MKNDKFPSTNMLIETIKTTLFENMSDYFLEDETLKANMLGELIDLGYDVLCDVKEENDINIDLLVRLSDGFMPIKICVNPVEFNDVKKSIIELTKLGNDYIDIRNGYIICLYDKNHNVFDSTNDRLIHKTDNKNIFWWGGRMLTDDDIALKQIEPLWTKEKLSVYGLRQKAIAKRK